MRSPWVCYNPARTGGLAIRAGLLSGAERNPKLVLTGKPWAEASVRALQCGNWKPSRGVHFTGYVPDEHLVWLYNASEMLLYPSFYEGSACRRWRRWRAGVPVIASNGARFEASRLWGHPCRPQPSTACGHTPSRPSMENEAVRARIWNAPSSRQALPLGRPPPSAPAVYEQAACAERGRTGMTPQRWRCHRWKIRQTDNLSGAADALTQSLHPLWRGIRGAGYEDPETAYKLLKPRWTILLTRLLPDASPAVARLARAIEHGGARVDYGDYDVDGVSSARCGARRFPDWACQ